MSATSTHVSHTWDQQPRVATFNLPGDVDDSFTGMLVFDFVLGSSTAARILEADELCALLAERPIPYVVSTLDIDGGRRVWVPLLDDVDAYLLGLLAGRLHDAYPTGHVSIVEQLDDFKPDQVVAGDVEILDDPWVSFDDVVWLLERLRGLPHADPVDDTIDLTTIEGAWTLTRLISPRQKVHAALVEADGTIRNIYPALTQIDGPAPTVPWALPLTDHNQRFKLLAFDFDVKKHGVAAAHRDAAALVHFLEEASIPYLTCKSGPADGRHVWVALSESVPAHDVDLLARLTKRLLPTLDLCPLVNGTAGRCRPPGAPHRNGGTSTPIEGTLTVLTHPQTTRFDVRALTEAIAAGVSSQPASLETVEPHLISTDDDGHPYLLGTRRGLGPRATNALTTTPSIDDDASAHLWTILLGAAVARWHHHDIRALVDTTPGLEYLRTARNGSTRVARPLTGPGSIERTLTHQWRRAVNHIASHSPTVGNDDTFDHRAGATATTILTVQTRAQASKGRWDSPHGLVDRAVLDTLCRYTLQAVTLDIETSIRTIALDLTVGRETVRLALERLHNEHWIACLTPAASIHARHFTIDPTGDIHREATHEWSQVNTPPLGSGSALRSTILHEMSTHADLARHEAFCPQIGLGLAAGRVYGFSPPRETAERALPMVPTDGPSGLSAQELADEVGLDLTLVEACLSQLEDGGLVRCRNFRWSRLDPGRRDLLAQQLGITGTLEARRVAYGIEREMWAAWQAEQAWLRAPAVLKHAQRVSLPDPTKARLRERGVPGAYPRHSNGHPNHAAARALLALVA